MTEDEFAQLTADYIVATEERLAFIKGVLPATAAALETYRELADREWELGLAWDAELIRSVEESG